MEPKPPVPVGSAMSAPVSFEEQQAEHWATTIRAWILRLQASLQPGEELILNCTRGAREIRVHKIQFSKWNVAIIIGQETDARVELIGDIRTMELTSTIVKLQSENEEAIIVEMEDAVATP